MVKQGLRLLLSVVGFRSSVKADWAAAFASETG
jgi:hypothetical protein